MPRSRGNSFSNKSSTARAPAPKPNVQQQPAVQQKSGGMFSGLGSTLMQGMAFGAGSEIAHSAIRGVMGGGNHSQQVEQTQQQQQQLDQTQQTQQQNNCQQQQIDFTNCLQRNNDISGCQHYLDIVKECNKQ